MNMALDEALLEGARDGAVTLRFYRFDPPCLSLGRHERARGLWDEAAAARLGVDIVRRPTGGRAVYHGPELTYAVAAPVSRWGGLRESCRRIHRALRAGLAALGVEAAAAPAGSGRTGSRRAPRGGPSHRRGAGRRPARRRGPAAGAPEPCFRSPAPGEVLAGGRKLVGSAQWREDGALLQHGSILLRDEQGRIGALRRSGAEVGKGPGTEVPAEHARPTGAVGLADLLPALPSADDMVAALTPAFEEEFGLVARPGGWSAGERARALSLVDRYRSDAWTWRR